MALKRRSKVDSGFSMSSMTDIVFLLLIFFMITSTMVTPPANKDLVLPKSDHQVSAKPNTTISVTKDLKYFIAGEEISFWKIERRLKEIMAAEPETYIALHVDETVPFSVVGKIRDIAIRNKYKLILATQAR
ncbi:ExbD/TolR family protein [Saccharicrinis fermentans]|uniref:Biopolymer transport protein ExbD n=1 Tax=Saccharicrinis fermentans DSM 9555 = JCM 21142 TaxID=869213 RepID=W7XZP3_9BACT|nr:biopolymer transporter ExbD [Saccharicrinis fermentans]GAF04130.1 biopolymer transport protein ExbD [Saccharicrinis fermentans DSM 9555 = JCM 21142]